MMKMDLKALDLNELTILWQASGGAPQLRTLIEDELKIRTKTNTRFSREDLFKVSKVQNHVITISFIPTTTSYKMYGESVTIKLWLSDREISELSGNYNASPPINTQGQLRAKALVKNNMTNSQLKRLEDVGFYTNEILEVLHL